MATKTPVAKATTRTTTKAVVTKAAPAIERKALAADTKSDGMRMLFDAGYSVVQVKGVFNAPYGFVYGVAQRHGVADTAATRRVPKASAKKGTKAATTAKAKVVAKPAAKPTTAARRTKASLTSKPATIVTTPKKATAAKPSTASTATARVAAKLASRQAIVTPTVTKVKGRPTAERRAANRKAPTTTETATA